MKRDPLAEYRKIMPLAFDPKTVSISELASVCWQLREAQHFGDTMGEFLRDEYFATREDRERRRRIKDASTWASIALGIVTLCEEIVRRWREDDRVPIQQSALDYMERWINKIRAGVSEASTLRQELLKPTVLEQPKGAERMAHYRKKMRMPEPGQRRKPWNFGKLLEALERGKLQSTIDDIMMTSIAAGLDDEECWAALKGQASEWQALPPSAKKTMMDSGYPNLGFDGFLKLVDRRRSARSPKPRAKK